MSDAVYGSGEQWRLTQYPEYGDNVYWITNEKNRVSDCGNKRMSSGGDDRDVGISGDSGDNSYWIIKGRMTADQLKYRAAALSTETVEWTSSLR